MNSSISDNLNREHLALETAKCLKNIFANSQNVTALHKELLEINLSITAYIEESKNRLESLRLDLAQQATSSQRVVEILSDKQIMSNLPKTPQKRKSRIICSELKDTTNNFTSPYSKQQSARSFITWYKRLIDNNRQSLGLYLSDDVTLEWFGRTVKSRKKVSTFLKYDMQCSRHDFTTVESIDKIYTRQELSKRLDDLVLASPLNSPELGIPKLQKNSKRKIISSCGSPKWAEGCNPDDETEVTNKRIKRHHNESVNVELNQMSNAFNNEISNDGDCNFIKKRKRTSTTPPNIECGQGDCRPSTSGASLDRSHETLNAQLPKLAVECNGYVEFTRTRNGHSSDSMKWERKCKLQICYSHDPLNVGEFIIWALQYNDESKCRRNLLAAFEDAANE